MSKSRKKSKRRPFRQNISALTLLRPRLDKLLAEESLVEKETQVIKADLDALVTGLEATDILPILLKAYQNAPAQVQARLDEVVPEWLEQRRSIRALLEMLKQQGIDREEQKSAHTWLEGAGVDISDLEELQEQTSFYQAFRYSDDSQGVIIVLWYTGRWRRKIRGMNFLIDFNPPWEGAVKDIMLLPPRSPRRAMRDYVDVWAQRGMPLESAGAAEAKREVLKSLEANRREKIGCHRNWLALAANLSKIYSVCQTSQTPHRSQPGISKSSVVQEKPRNRSCSSNRRLDAGYALGRVRKSL
ncbi:MAG: hypothetical protein U9R25_09165 [Chloroflexota bacterium]|nr:hypothetical protein [Chloroflexota bacterium]